MKGKHKKERLLLSCAMDVAMLGVGALVGFGVVSRTVGLLIGIPIMGFLYYWYSEIVNKDTTYYNGIDEAESSDETPKSESAKKKFPHKSKKSKN